MLCGSLLCFSLRFLFFFFKQKTAYEMRISDWSSDVCSSDLEPDYSQPASAPSIVPVDVPPSSVDPSASAMSPDAPPSIDQAPPPPSDWRQTVAVDPVAEAIVNQTDYVDQIARAMAARPPNGATDRKSVVKGKSVAGLGEYGEGG